MKLVEEQEDVILRAVGDPLTETTRKVRKSLLIFSAFAFSIVHANIVTSNISLLGIEVTVPNQISLLQLMRVVSIYVLVAFVAYSFSGLVAWGVHFRRSFRELVNTRIPSEDQLEEIEFSERMSEFAKDLGFAGNYAKPLLALPSSILRATVDFIIPVLCGIYAIYILFTHTP